MANARTKGIIFPNKLIRNNGGASSKIVNGEQIDISTINNDVYYDTTNLCTLLQQIIDKLNVLDEKINLLDVNREINVLQQISDALKIE